METLELFEVSNDTAPDADIIIERVAHPMHFKRESPEERATRRIADVLRKRHPCILAFSAGKDSSCLAALALNAARGLIEAGEYCPPIVVTHGDTGVEQPEIVELAKNELAKMQAYAAQHGISLTTRISHPQLAASWPVRVIGGRALPPYPSTRADCSSDWKIQPNQRTTELVLAELKKREDLNEPVVMTGVRLGESVARDQRVAKRQEVAEGLWRNEFGLLRLSPILDFDTESVWEMLGLANAGIIDAYSDFSETIRLYRDASGECVIVADMKANALSKPCGTRTGCWSCTRVGHDLSMKNMIEADEARYGRLRPLARLRDFLSNAQYDWSLRQYVGRSIDEEGCIVIQADTFSADTLKKLLRYTLTAQILSGVPIISLQQLIAIDARWSLYGLCPPFTALKIYFEVEREGKLEQAPEIPRFPHTPVPRLGKIKVGAPTYGQALQGTATTIVTEDGSTHSVYPVGDGWCWDIVRDESDEPKVDLEALHAAAGPIPQGNSSWMSVDSGTVTLEDGTEVNLLVVLLALGQAYADSGDQTYHDCMAMVSAITGIELDARGRFVTSSS